MHPLQEAIMLQNQRGQAMLAFAQAHATESQGHTAQAHAVFQGLVPLQAQLLQQARALAQAAPVDVAGFTLDLMRTLLRLAGTSEWLGQPDTVAWARAEAAAVSRLLGVHGTIELGRDEARLHQRRGRFADALDALVRSERLAHGSGQDLLKAEVALDLADLYQWLGDHERCLTTLARAREI